MEAKNLNSFLQAKQILINKKQLFLNQLQYITTSNRTIGQKICQNKHQIQSTLLKHNQQQEMQERKVHEAYQQRLQIQKIYKQQTQIHEIKKQQLQDSYQRQLHTLKEVSRIKEKEKEKVKEELIKQKVKHMLQGMSKSASRPRLLYEKPQYIQ